MPNSDIFNPPTESSEAEGRDLQRTNPASGAAQTSSIESPLPVGRGSPISSDPFPVQPVDSAQPTPKQTATPPSNQETGGQATSPALFTVPSILDANKYLDVTGNQASFIDPSKELLSGAAYNMGQLDVNTLIQNVQGIPYVPRDNLTDTSHSLDGQMERVNKIIQDAKQNEDNFYQYRDKIFTEEQNYRRNADKSLTPKIPVIDGDISTNGLASELAKSLQELIDPKKTANHVGSNGITDFLFRDISNILRAKDKWAENLGDKDTNPVTKTLKTGLSYLLNPVGNLHEFFDPTGHAAVQQQIDTNTGQTLVRLGNRNNTQEISDYGNAGLVSVGMRVLNTAWSAVVGLGYDVVDNTVMRYHNNGRDPHQGSRVWQAIIEGRDWGIENQWSAEKYLSWAEPETLRGKGKTTTEFFKEADPNNTLPNFLKEGARRWWDLPENTAEGLQNLGSNYSKNREIYNATVKPLHWLIQGVPTYTVAFLADGGLDNLTSLAVKKIVTPVKNLVSTAKAVDRALESADVALDDLAPVFKQSNQIPDGVSLDIPKNTVDRAIPKPPTSTTPKTPTGQLPKLDPTVTEELLRVTNPDHINDIVIPIKKGLPVVDTPVVAKLDDFVNHTVKSNLIDSPNLISPRLLNTVPRNTDDLTILAKRLLDDSGNPLLDVRRVKQLTDNEIGALRNLDSVNLGEMGLPVNRQLDNANVVQLPNGDVLQLPKYPHLKDDSLPYDSILGINSENALNKYNSLTDKLKNATTLEEQVRIQDRRLIAVAKLADNGQAYQAVQERLPRILRSESPDVAQIGNDMISREVQLAGEGSELRRINLDVNDLQRKVTLLKEEQVIYPYYRGNLNEELATKEFYSGIPNQRLSNIDNIPEVPLPREVPPTRVKKPQVVLPKSINDWLDFQDKHGRGIPFENFTDNARGINLQVTPNYRRGSHGEGKGLILWQLPEEMRGKGVGSKLLQGIIDKYPKLPIYIEEANEISGRVAQKLGFIRDETINGWVHLPENSKQVVNGIDLPPKWQHGTTSTADIRRVDPIVGASSSEFGKGIYLTLDEDVAKAASLKGNLNNRPYPTNFSDDFSKPRIHTVDVSSLENVIQGTETIERKHRQMWKISAKSSLLETLDESVDLPLKSGLTYSEMFNEFQVSYRNTFGDLPSEITLDNFQSRLTKALVDDGVEGMYIDKNGIKTLVVYKPSELVVNATVQVDRVGDTLETLEAKRFLEGVTANQLGDDVSLGLYTQAKRDLADYQLQRAVEAKVAKEQHIGELINDVTDLEDEIVTKNAKVHSNTVRDTLDNTPKRIDTRYTESLDTITKDPC
jgi:hypothetical protein